MFFTSRFCRGCKQDELIGYTEIPRGFVARALASRKKELKEKIEIGRTAITAGVESHDKAVKEYKSLSLLHKMFHKNPLDVYDESHSLRFKNLLDLAISDLSDVESVINQIDVSSARNGNVKVSFKFFKKHLLDYKIKYENKIKGI